MADTPQGKLDFDAKEVGQVMARMYTTSQTKEFTLRQLQAMGVGGPRKILFALYELESRGFGKVIGKGMKSVFKVSRTIVDVRR